MGFGDLWGDEMVVQENEFQCELQEEAVKVYDLCFVNVWLSEKRQKTLEFQKLRRFWR